jgi:hypothetical protein
MADVLNPDTLHRTAKYFMDSGRVATHDAAMELLGGFGLTIHAGEEVAYSADHQMALLTLVNLARRTLLGGVEVSGLPDCESKTAVAAAISLKEAVTDIGGVAVECARPGWPAAMIGTCVLKPTGLPCWQLTWEGWRGGVVPACDGLRLAENGLSTLAPAMAAAACASEVFSHYASDHPMAGRRSSGLSLWRPGAHWTASDESEPALSYLPSGLWIIGLGNLGQAFLWLLACLPYENRGEVTIVLQDFDRIASSNHSTSLLSAFDDVGRKKTRVVSDWLEARGFATVLEERMFGAWTKRGPHEPGVAFCGVDNALARTALENSGFDLVVEAGLGAGPNAFRSFSVHAFPSSRSAASIWSRHVGEARHAFGDQPAYRALKEDGMDECGVAQLASRTVAAPFVGLIAAGLALSELLRRLHGGCRLELASGSLAALEDIDFASMPAAPYASGHVLASAG